MNANKLWSMRLLGHVAGAGDWRNTYIIYQTSRGRKSIWGY